MLGSFFCPVAPVTATNSGLHRRGEVKKMGERITAECDNCGFEIYQGESYYYINGEFICVDCLGEYAARLLAPFRIGGEA